MAKSLTVYIRGDGIAARCCAHLLRKAGVRVFGTVGTGNHARVPAIMLSDLALSLMQDVFEQPSLFSREFRIQRRHVAWGDGGVPSTVAHSAAVVSERKLLDALPLAVTTEMEPQECDFVIHAAPPLPGVPPRQRFGARDAESARVHLKESNAVACEIESVSHGWLFLIPTSKDAWLLGVGGPITELLQESRHIANKVEIETLGAARFDAAPAIAETIHDAGWLACGPVALGFDPLCGDGTAHAVREAILACAVVRALLRGEDRRAVLKHYEAVLTLGMMRHIDLCRDYYTAGGSDVWWRQQVDALDIGREWCAARMVSAGPRKYRLENFDLVHLTGDVSS